MHVMQLAHLRYLTARGLETSDIFRYSFLVYQAQQ